MSARLRCAKSFLPFSISTEIRSFHSAQPRNLFPHFSLLSTIARGASAENNGARCCASPGFSTVFVPTLPKKRTESAKQIVSATRNACLRPRDVKLVGDSPLGRAVECHRSRSRRVTSPSVSYRIYVDDDHHPRRSAKTKFITTVSNRGRSLGYFHAKDVISMEDMLVRGWREFASAQDYVEALRTYFSFLRSFGRFPPIRLFIYSSSTSVAIISANANIHLR